MVEEGDVRLDPHLCNKALLTTRSCQLLHQYLKHSAVAVNDFSNAYNNG